MYVFWRIVAIIYIQFRTEDVTILVEILENRFENEMGRKRKNRSIKIYLGIGKILYIFFFYFRVMNLDVKIAHRVKFRR